MPKNVIRDILIMALGGILLFVCTVFLNMFVSTPPTRAEFDSFKSEFIATQKSIDKRLERIETAQSEILNKLIGE